MLRKKSQVTRPGIDPGTFQLVAQRLNHYAAAGLYFLTIKFNVSSIPNEPTDWRHTTLASLRWRHSATHISCFKTPKSLLVVELPPKLLAWKDVLLLWRGAVNYVQITGNYLMWLLLFCSHLGSKLSFIQNGQLNAEPAHHCTTAAAQQMTSFARQYSFRR